ncbi:MAG: hypothetical protein AVDCRST_MAG89-2971, partial [uncultured Gemmatimonadetes bacterium]
DVQAVLDPAAGGGRRGPGEAASRARVALHGAGAEPGVRVEHPQPRARPAAADGAGDLRRRNAAQAQGLPHVHQQARRGEVGGGLVGAAVLPDGEPAYVPGGVQRPRPGARHPRRHRLRAGPPSRDL